MLFIRVSFEIGKTEEETESVWFQSIVAHEEVLSIWYGNYISFECSDGGSERSTSISSPPRKVKSSVISSSVQSTQAGIVCSEQKWEHSSLGYVIWKDRKQEEQDTRGK